MEKNPRRRKVVVLISSAVILLLAATTIFLAKPWIPKFKQIFSQEALAKALTAADCREVELEVLSVKVDTQSKLASKYVDLSAEPRQAATYLKSHDYLYDLALSRHFENNVFSKIDAISSRYIEQSYPERANDFIAEGWREDAREPVLKSCRLFTKYTDRIEALWEVERGAEDLVAAAKRVPWYPEGYNPEGKAIAWRWASDAEQRARSCTEDSCTFVMAIYHRASLGSCPNLAVAYHVSTKNKKVLAHLKTAVSVNSSASSQHPQVIELDGGPSDTYWFYVDSLTCTSKALSVIDVTDPWANEPDSSSGGAGDGGSSSGGYYERRCSTQVVPNPNYNPYADPNLTKYGLNDQYMNKTVCSNVWVNN